MKAILTLLACLVLVACGDGSQVKIAGKHHPDAIKKALCSPNIQYVVLPDICKK